jgi:alpha-beta hydrolase superfamily lysophospholipase
LTRVALAIALAVMVFATASVRGATQRVSFRTDDGLTLAGTWYEPSTRPAPAVIFVHMLQKSRRDWDQFASRLSGEGIGALTFDLRGHGESPGSAQDYAAMVNDVRAARRFVAARGDVAPTRIGIAGASIGASLAVLAADDSSVAAVVLLSPAMDYRGLRMDAAIKKYGARPLLLVASDDDGYSMRTVRDLQKAGGGGVRDSMLLSRAGNGTAMLANDPDLGRRLVDWLRRTLL